MGRSSEGRIYVISSGWSLRNSEGIVKGALLLAPLHFARILGTHGFVDRCFGRGSKEEPTGKKMLHGLTR